MLHRKNLTGWLCTWSLASLALGCGDSSTDVNQGGSRFEGDAANGGDGSIDPLGPPLEGTLGDGSNDASEPADAAAPTCAAAVVEVGKPKVDIVFAIDNSGSMDAEMTQVKANVNAFARTIGQSGVDYRVIMMVSKASSPTQTGLVLCVPAPLGGANCTDNLPTFRYVNQSVGSTNALSLLLSTYDSANPVLSWRSSLRPDALKAFVVVTDDQSAITAQAFDAQLLAKAPAGMFGTAANRRYVLHAIAGWQEGTPLLSASKCATAVNTGSRYQELARLTGGLVESVCKTDYSSVLSNIARNTTQRLACELSLPTQANADPHKVAVQVTLPGGSPSPLTRVLDASRCGASPNAWYYDDNARPTRVMLCGDTCANLSAQRGAKVEALVGCVVEVPR